MNMEQTNPNLIPKKVVSELEESLTSEGWEWKANESTMIEVNPYAMFTSYAPLEGRDTPIPDEEIKEKYQSSFPSTDIRLEQAYDSRGKFLPWHKAVYIRERSER